jgi:hypothetical protein
MNKNRPTMINDWDLDMNRIMSENNFNQIYWSCEKIKGSVSIYHTHLLIDSNNSITDSGLVDYFKEYLENGREISYKSNLTSSKRIISKSNNRKKIRYDEKTNRNERLVEYKWTRTLIDNSGNKLVRDYDIREFVPFYEIVGKNGRCFVERVIGLSNSSLYINKYTGRGVTTGYLNKN